MRRDGPIYGESVGRFSLAGGHVRLRFAIRAAVLTRLAVCRARPAGVRSAASPAPGTPARAGSGGPGPAIPAAGRRLSRWAPAVIRGMVVTSDTGSPVRTRERQPRADADAAAAAAARRRRPASPARVMTR